MVKYFIPFAIYFGATTDNLFGQSLTAIQLDRPDQTECPFITPKKYIQIENVFTFETINQSQTSFSYPSTLWKYGVNEKFELRLITELVSGNINVNSNTGFSPITIGFKTSLFEERGFLPKTSFIGHIATSKIGSKEFQTKYIAPSFRLTMQHTLTEKISLAYNIGAEWNGENAEHSYIYTLTTGFSLTDKIGCYTELYGFIPTENKADYRFDCGLTYLINNDFMADISGGLGLSENAPQNYISLGLSYRFKTTR
ncbi:MAG: transporter [Bacteroidota bacterium]